MSIIGIDIGGTKCLAVRADDDGTVQTVRRCTTGGAEDTVARLLDAVAGLEPGPDPVFGVSCGGPLDVAAGLICSPPNLPGWDRVPILDLLTSRFGGRGFLMNDADAGALAEWRCGAGVGTRDLVFLTFGTGIGAGLICGGRLHEGATGNSGEIGHVRLSDDGPLGHGKHGSVEGWCSGGGLARRVADLVAAGGLPRAWPHRDAQALAQAARSGEADAARLLQDTGRMLGRTIAILIDILNPEVVVLGSIFVRARNLLEGPLRDELAREALPGSLAACRIVPSALGERLGEHQAVAVAIHRTLQAADGEAGPRPVPPSPRRRRR